MSTLLRDLRLACRAMRRRRLHASAVVLTIGIVVGTNAALFAALSATLLRPLPFTAGDATVLVHGVPPGARGTDVRSPLHAIDLVRFRARARTLAAVAASTVAERVLTGRGDPQTVRVAAVNAELWDLLDLRPTRGRLFTAAEDTPGAAVAVLGSGAARRIFGQADAGLGATVTVNGQVQTVIGVLPPGFVLPFLDADLYVPLGLTTAAPLPPSRLTDLRTIARLRAGTTLEEADAEIRSLMAGLAAEFPDSHRGWSAGVLPIRQWLYGSMRTPLLVLFAATTMLLGIAAANVGTLTLGQAAARAGEFAVRRAVGASSWDVARTVLLEQLVLCGAGAALGLALAAVLLPLLLAIDPVAARSLGPVSVDWRVGAYAGASAIAAALVAALLPSVHLASPDLRGAMLGGAGRSGAPRTRRWQHVLLASQSALCLVLLVGGVMLLRTLARAERIAPGFDPDSVLTAELRLAPAKYPTLASRAAVVDDLTARLRSLPRVEAASAAVADFRPGLSWVTTLDVEGQPTADGTPHTVQFRRVHNDYFRTLRIPLLAGRSFGPEDGPQGTTAAVVSRALAQRFWGEADPLGRRVKRGDRWLTVIGVVDDVRDVNVVEPPQPTLYLSWSQSNTANPTIILLARTNGNPLAAAADLRTIVRTVDPAAALGEIRPLTGFVEASLAPQRFRTTLLATLGSVGLILGALGVAASTARAIQERMTELGIRLALGGGRAALWRGAVLRPLRAVGAGAAVGLPTALLAARLLRAVLPGTTGVDMAAVAAAAAALLVAALAAAAVPAARIFRVDPCAVLRQ